MPSKPMGVQRRYQFRPNGQHSYRGVIITREAERARHSAGGGWGSFPAVARVGGYL